MATKLLIFTDTAIARDSKPLPGVSDVLTMCERNGWAIAIVSNADCAVHKCPAADFPVGAFYQATFGEPIRVIRKTLSEDVVMLHLAEPLLHGKDYARHYEDETIRYQHRSESSVISEAQYLLKRLPQDIAIKFYFSPDTEGRYCFAGDLRRFDEISWRFVFRGYRMPDTGMINVAIIDKFPITQKADECIMVGTEPEHEQAAIAADIRFSWAHDFIK